MNMNKDSIPDDAEYYTSGEIKKYWKKKDGCWWIWSKMLKDWIMMYTHATPDNLVKMPETNTENVIHQFFLKNLNNLKMEYFRSGGFINRDPDMVRLSIDLKIKDNRELIVGQPFHDTICIRNRWGEEAHSSI